ncbi:MAG: HesA/MoeB/ThiF family protein [Coriobacteriia bacterium]|nr:HesA/MoeB/ThiF family protein [Coriobacteriia bacterium]
MAFEHRYDRNHQALSDDDCRVLSCAQVTVVGCGGLGGYVAEQLARLGVGRLRLVDADVFQESNLNRQLFCTEQTLDAPKVQVAAQRLAAVNSQVQVEPCQQFLDAGNAAELIAGSQCVVDCLDNVESRFVLACACADAGVPLVYGAIAGWFGQVGTVFPGDVSFVTLYGAVEGAPGEPAPSGVQKTEGNLPFAAGVTASFQAAEAAKVLLGKDDLLRNRLLMIDLLFGSVEEMPLR